MTDPHRLTRSIVNMEPLSLSSEFGFTSVLDDVKAVVVLVICEALTNMLLGDLSRSPSCEITNK